MRTQGLTIGLVATLIAAGGCNNQAGDNRTAAQTPEARKAAGSKTIAAGLTQDTRFMAAAKAAGLDQTLAGPNPYTVLVPDDAAFAKAPEGMLDTKPENRAQLTGVLTNLILPGVVLAADIDKAIERGKGKAVFATMGGGTLTATKEGGKIVFTDAKGNKATVTRADDNYSNGAVHHVDAVLMPADDAEVPPAKAG
ncbi:MAG TPA: fasciclin domain-containing protein [Sphingomicrobium sp.]|nr:fasciclin domain-containing protein [Sphingomicrobium sp.]